MPLVQKLFCVKLWCARVKQCAHMHMGESVYVTYL